LCKLVVPDESAMHGQTPSLAPELWNLSAVVVLCGLLGWVVRLVRLTLTYLETQFSIQQSAVRCGGPQAPWTL
jgi:hypothetical protein